MNTGAMPSARITNAMTVDVEDYYQVEAFTKYIDRSQWGEFASHVDKNTNLILEMLGEKNIKATFFTLGCVAERSPALVRKIVDSGHEIASHGYSHEAIYKQTPEKFRQETVRSKAILEDISQAPVRGYRAATYSITNKSLWALDILVEAGFVYDSSIFPIHHDRYGIADIDPLPHKLTTPQGKSLVEFPISTLDTGLINLPVAGGGYFRLFPYRFTKWALGKVNDRGNEFVFYIHPWELDQTQPVIEEADPITRFRHYNNIKRCKLRFDNLLSDFQFDTLWSVLEQKGLVAA